MSAPRPNIVVITCEPDALRAALDRHLDATGDPFRHMRIDLQMPADAYADVKGIKS